MKQFLSILLLSVLSFSANAQNISGKGGTIPDNGSEVLFPITVDGIAPTSENFGLAAVQLDINHSWTSDLEIHLIAPDGFRYKLSIANGGSGQNYENTIFTMDASVNITDADAPFAGSFIPQDNLNYANKTKNTNGIWKLAIKDTAIENTGTLNNWSLRFGSIQPFSVASAPSCLSNPLAANTCSTAPVVCNLGGYCGNTSSTYTADSWSQLTSTFCSGIQNNSFITFTAGATTVNFNLWVYGATNTDGTQATNGLQMMIYSGGCGSGAVTSYGCNSNILPTTGGVNGIPTIVTASGLTIGNTYYIMFDGFGGVRCSYVMQAIGSGVSIFALSPSSNQTICNAGDSVTLTASGSSTYTWTGPAGFVPPTSLTQSVVVATIPGTYTVSSTGGCSAKSVSISTYVSPYNTPTAAQDLYSATTFNLKTNDTFILNGQTASDFDISYHRTQADALNVTNMIPNPLTYSIQPATATQETIWVSLTDNRANGGSCIRAVSFVIYKLLPLTATNSGPVCADAGTFNLFCTSAGAGYTYEWNGPNGYTANVQNPTGVPIPIGGAGSYVYTVTPIGTPAMLPVSTTVIVNPTATITGTPSSCMGNTTQLTGSGVAAATNPWVSATPAVATVNNTGLVTPVSAGTTLITYTDNNGCTATQTVTINALPTISGTPTSCMGNTTQLTGSGTPASTNPWNSSNTAVATIDNTGLITPVSAGTTNITYTDNNGCVSLPTVVTINALPTITGTPVSCMSSTTQLTGSGVAAVINPWVSATPAVATIDNTGLVTPVSAGTTLITYTDNNGCTATQTVTINALPTISGASATFNTYNSQLTGSGTAAMVNPWTSSNPAVAAVDNTGLVTGLSVGTTNITFKDSNGCTSLPRLFTINALIVPTFTQVAPICWGAVLAPLPTTSTNGITGVWSPAMDNTNTTTYTFTPDAGQGGLPTTMTIVVNLLPTISGISTICADGTTQLTGSGVAATTNTWISATPAVATVDNTGLVTPVSAGTTLITYTDNNGCAATQTVTIKSLPTATVTGTTATCLNSSTLPVITFTAANGVSPYTFTYNINGGAAQTITTALGNNTVTLNASTNLVGTFNYNLVSVQDANCSQNQSSTATITVITAPILTNTVVTYEICDDAAYPAYANDGVADFFLHSQDANFTGGNAALTVTYYETLIDAQFNVNAITLNPYNNYLNPHNHTLYVRVTDSTLPGACASFAELHLKVNPIPVPTLVIPDFVKCDDNAPTGVETFNLHDWDIICGMTANTTATYYANDPSIIIGNPQLNYLFTTNSTTIWVKLTDNITGCWGKRKFNIVVNPLPFVPKPVPSYTLCETSTPPDFIEIFNLSSQNANVTTTAGMIISYHFSYADAVNNISLPNLYTNNSPVPTPGVQTIFVKVTNSITGCYDISTMDLRVNQIPVPVAPLVPYVTCSANQSGWACFDLVTIGQNISNNPNTTVTFYDTYSNAETGPILGPANQLPSPYCNQTSTLVQIIYARVEDNTTHCYKIINVELNSPVAPVAPITGLFHDLVACDDHDTNNLDGITNFDLNEAFLATSNANAFLGLQPLAASNYTIKFHTTLAAAMVVGGAYITTPNNYFNQTASPQQIWISIENNTTHCRNWGSFNLIVNRPLPLSTPPRYDRCDDDTALPPRVAFDLTVQNSIILTGAPSSGAGYTVTYYTDTTYATPISATNATAYINLANAQTLGVMVTTPQGCKSYTTLTIRVLPIPTPRTTNLPTPVLITCDNTAPALDGIEVMDLTVNQTYIDNAGGYQFEYYSSYVGGVLSGLIPTPTAAAVSTGDVYIKVMNTLSDWQGNKCYVVITQPIIVNPLPVISKVNPTGATVPTDLTNTYQICRDSASTLPAGQAIFNLPTQNIALLTGNPATSSFTVTYYLTATAATNGVGALTNAQSIAFQNTTNPQTIHVRVVNNTTGCVNTGSYDLLVNPQPIVASNLANFSSCDTDGNNDGMMLYPQNPTNPTVASLAGYISDILGPTQATGFTVSIYTTQALAMAGVASTAIQNLSIYQVQTGTYWIRVENDVTKCYILDDFNVVIEKLATPNITPLNGRDTICVKWGTSTVIPGSEVTLDSGVPVGSPAAYSYQWYYNTGTALVAIPGATSQTYTIQGTPTYLSGDYSVVVTSLSTLACPSEPSNVFTVKKSGPASIGVPEYFVSNAFADNQTVTVNYLGGFGVYEYSLDGGPWQSSPVFENIPFGSHSIEIKDVASTIYSCSTPPIEGIYTIDFPHFFTPNGDGQNDTWNISGLSNQSDAKIYIFDRYGKLVKQISSCNGCGWDGTFVGKPLPADDYWFTVEFAEDTNTRIFKSHFTLKR